MTPDWRFPPPSCSHLSVYLHRVCLSAYLHARMPDDSSTVTKTRKHEEERKKKKKRKKRNSTCVLTSTIVTRMLSPTLLKGVHHAGAGSYFRINRRWDRQGKHHHMYYGQYTCMPVFCMYACHPGSCHSSRIESLSSHGRTVCVRETKRCENDEHSSILMATRMP
jgi:hypothetical protein